MKDIKERKGPYYPTTDLEKDSRLRPIFGRNENGVPICNSLLSGGEKTGKRCQSTIRMENGRCRTHGGSIPRGYAHPNTRINGSKFAGLLPKHKAETLQQLLENPDYLSLQEDIAMTDLDQLDLVSELGTLDADAMPKLLVALHSLEHAVELAEFTGDPDILVQRARECVEYAQSLQRRNEIKSELRDVREHKRRLVETDMTRVFKGRTQIPIDRVFALVTSMALIVRSAVLDIVPREYVSALLGRIQREVNILMPIVYPTTPAAEPTQPALEQGER